MQWFDFSMPIGWQELSAIATALAVILALWSNHKTTQQMRDTLRIQEQSKNLELFDKRVHIIHTLEIGEEPSALEVRLLFNQDIVNTYNDWKKLKAEQKSYRNDLKTYEFLISEACEAQDKPSPLHDIHSAKWIMEQSDFQEDKVKAYEDLCNDNEISSSYGSPNDEWRTYNFKTISDSINESQRAVEYSLRKLIDEMSSFVQTSITSLLAKKDAL